MYYILIIDNNNQEFRYKATELKELVGLVRRHRGSINGVKYIKK